MRHVDDSTRGGRLKSPLVASTENHPWPFLVAKQTEHPPGGLINPVIE